MRDHHQNPKQTLDLDRVGKLIELMKDSDLSELTLHCVGMRLKLRRGPSGAVMTVPMAMPAAPVAHAAPAAAAPAAPAKESAPAKPASNLIDIKSPIVGTFYSSPNPDAQPFVKVGSKVSAETTICIIEAMKVFNEIPAGVAGTVAEILISTGQPVEYGQVIFRVEP